MHRHCYGHDDSGDICEVQGESQEEWGVGEGTGKKVLWHGGWKGSEENKEQGDSHRREL